jgi:hypothetical protein
MLFQIKNIILYTPAGEVAGFIEIKTENGKTNFRLKQDISKNLFLSLVINGKPQVINIQNNVTNFVLDKEIDLTNEIFVCLVKQDGDKVTTVATGIINPKKEKPKEKNNESNAIMEIDNAIKKMCAVDENGNGDCEKCPYREYFFTPQKQA